MTENCFFIPHRKRPLSTTNTNQSPSQKKRRCHYEEGVLIFDEPQTVTKKGSLSGDTMTIATKTIDIDV